MSTKKINSREIHYLYSVDLLQGLFILPMIFIHALLWFDSNLALNYEKTNSGLIVFLGLLVFPCFLFLSGFNQVNSLKHNLHNKDQYRKKMLKRSGIFIIIGIWGQFAVILNNLERNSPYLLNYLFTWNFFHLYGFSTLYILILWELSTYLKKDKENSQNSFTTTLNLNCLLIAGIYLLLYDYVGHNAIYQPVPYIRLLEYALLDINSVGIIPWIIFSLSGGVIAQFLDLSNHSLTKIRSKTKQAQGSALFLLYTGIVFLLLGDRYVSPVIRSPVSLSHLAISLGFIIFLFLELLLLADFSQIHFNERIESIIQIILNLGQLSLTIYLLHSALFLLNPEIIPSELFFYLLISWYSILIIALAYFWKRSEFKYSFEWIIRKSTN